MLQRIRQFWRALTARLSNEDKRLIRQTLSPAEQRLFALLPLHEQVHSVRVTQSASQLSAHLPVDERALLLRAALLHDIGKTRYRLGPVAKSMAVLGDKLFPTWAQSRSDHPDSIFHAYHHHPAAGEVLGRNLSLSPRMTSLIADHHTIPNQGEDPLLTILRRADELN